MIGIRFKNQYNNPFRYNPPSIIKQLNKRSLQLYNSRNMNHQQIKQLIFNHLPQLQNKFLSIQKLSGLTNQTFAIKIDHLPLYIFKTFSQFDREMENLIVRQLSAKSLTPKVIFNDQSYRIQEFIINTNHPTIDELNIQSLCQRIIIHIYNFHSVTFEYEEVTLSDYIFSKPQICQLENYMHVQGQNNLEDFKSLCNRVGQVLKDRDMYAAELLPKTKESVRMCHNDLNNLNILFNQDKMHFIDFDYVKSNYLAYDIANFINETCIDYSVKHYPGFQLKYYKNTQEVKKLARMYPGYYENLQEEVVKFMSIVNLYWAIWSIKRYSLNKSKLFGVVEHGLMRVQLFHHYYKMIHEQEQNNIHNS